MSLLQEIFKLLEKLEKELDKNQHESTFSKKY